MGHRQPMCQTNFPKVKNHVWDTIITTANNKNDKILYKTASMCSSVLSPAISLLLRIWELRRGELGVESCAVHSPKTSPYKVLLVICYLLVLSNVTVPIYDSNLTPNERSRIAARGSKMMLIKMPTPHASCSTSQPQQSFTVSHAPIPAAADDRQSGLNMLTIGNSIVRKTNDRIKTKRPMRNIYIDHSIIPVSQLQERKKLYGC